MFPGTFPLLSFRVKRWISCLVTIFGVTPLVDFSKYYGSDSIHPMATSPIKFPVLVRRIRRRRRQESLGVNVDGWFLYTSPDSEFVSSPFIVYCRRGLSFTGSSRLRTIHRQEKDLTSHDKRGSQSNMRLHKFVDKWIFINTTYIRDSFSSFETTFPRRSVLFLCLKVVYQCHYLWLIFITIPFFVKEGHRHSFLRKEIRPSQFFPKGSLTVNRLRTSFFSIWDPCQSSRF